MQFGIVPSPCVFPYVPKHNFFFAIAIVFKWGRGESSTNWGRGERGGREFEKKFKKKEGLKKNRVAIVKLL